MIALFLNFGAKDLRVLVTSKSVTVLSINFLEAYQWLNSWFHCLPLVRTGQLQCSVFFLAIYSMFLGRSRGLMVSTLHIRCGYSYFTPPLSAHQFTMMRMCLPITSHLFLGEESSLLSPIISINWHTKVFRSCAVLLCHTIFPRIIAVP